MAETVKEKEKELAKMVVERFDIMLATQLKLIAEEKGVSVEQLCFCYDISITEQRMNDGYYRFWVEVK